MEKLESIEEIENVIKENKMTLLYFGTNTCGVCVDMHPKVLDILKKYPEVKSYEIDAHKDIKLSAEYNVFTIPVISVYAEGKEVIREARYISMDDIDQRIGRYYDMIFD